MRMKQSGARGFTIVPLVLVLALTMIALGLVIAFNTPGKATASGAYNSGYQAGLFVGPIVIGTFLVLLASRIAERRSHGLAMGICGTILLLANIAYGVNALRALGIVKPLPPKSGMVANAPPSTVGNVARSPETPTPRAEPKQDGLPRSTTPETPNPQPAPAQPWPSSNPPVSPPERPIREAPVRGVPAPAKDAAAGEAAKKVLAALRDEVVGECLALASRADGAYAKMRKPVTTISALNKAMDEFGELKADGEKLEKRLRDLNREAKERLAATSTDQFDTQRLAMEWERGLATFERANACSTLARTCETAQELFVILKDTLGKWKVDASGKVSGPDRNVENRLFGPRAQLGFALDRQVETLNDLRQGDAAKGK